MRTFAFSPTFGLIVDETDNFVTLSGLDALVQKVQNRLRFFLGEWFLNTTVGVPYFQEVFQKPVDPSLIVSIINTEIYKEQDVTEISDINFTYDSALRTFSYSAFIVSIYGSSQLNIQDILREVISSGDNI